MNPSQNSLGMSMLPQVLNPSKVSKREKGIKFLREVLLASLRRDAADLEDFEARAGGAPSG